MAIKDTLIDNVLLLNVDKGDRSKIDQVMKKWHFVDYQSFIRFAVSILLVTEDKFISIKLEGMETEIAPAKDLVLPKT